MLKLECTQKPNVSFPLLTNKTYIVGRKQGDITFSDDQSISRTHAEVVADHSLGNISEPMLTPVLVVTDVGSKFGTFATEENIKNKIAINAREAVNLSISDKIRFGLQWNEFRINYTPLVVTTSSVKATQDFKNKICKLGGHFVNEWGVYVTHVVMDSITLTIKAVCALLAAKPIVTQAYITDLLSSYETHKPEPVANNFLPAIAEKGLSKIDDSTFYPNPGRTTLFAGKTFLFTTQKHMKKLLPAIISGGGNAKLIADANTVNVLASEYIIMGQPLDIALAEKDPSVKIIIDTYRKGNKRFVGDSEIGLAAVYNSIEKHCNPRCNITDSVVPQLTTQTQSSSSSSSVIVPPTQDIDSQLSSIGDTSRSVVNETVLKPGTHADNSSPSSSLSSRGEKRPMTPQAVSVAGSSTSKKRSAMDVLPGRQSKRLKETQKSASQTSSNLSRSRAALSNLFGMSDSEDDDPVVVPESQPNESLTVDDEHVVPESQPALLNVVELRNLQSVMNTQESSVSVRKEDDDVFVIPESPPDQSLATFRNPGTDNILTVTESIMNAKTIPSTSFGSVEPSPPLSSSKKNVRLISQGRDSKNSSDGDGASRKRQRQVDEDESLSERTKKINLEEVKPKTEGSHDELLNSLPLIVLPLVNKTMLRRECYIAETINETGKPAVKNFKTFKKVLPSFLAVAGVSGSGSSNSASTLNVTIEEIQSKRPVVKLVHYDYSPGTSARYVSDLPPLVENRDRPLRDIEIETPPAFEELDEFVQPQPPARRTGRRLPEPAAVEEPTMSTRRSSPRKKAPPPPELPRATPAPVMEAMDEEEDEDDMWAFNR